MNQQSGNIGHSGSDPGIQVDLQFNALTGIGRIIFTNVNAEDNEQMEEQYQTIHSIIKKFEVQLKEKQLSAEN